MRRRAVAGLAVLGVLAPVASAQIIPTFRKDSAKDGRGALDIVRVAMSRGTDGRLRGEVTMEKGVDHGRPALRARARRGRSA